MAFLTKNFEMYPKGSIFATIKTKTLNDMKKILTLTFALVAMTLICSCNSNGTGNTQTQDTTVNVSTLSVDAIEHIPLTQGFDRVEEYLFQELEFKGDFVVDADSQKRCIFMAWNKIDHSIVHMLGTNDPNAPVEKLWIEWESEEVMPQGLKPIETVKAYDGKGQFIIGKWKNYYIYSRDGVNFLDGNEPQKIIDDQLWKRTANIE